MLVKDIAWIAGLLEGEGSFTMTGKNSGYKISIVMNDKDVISRAARILGWKFHSHPYSKHGAYRISLCGDKAIQWMMTIYSFMGARRKAKIKEILTTWRNHMPPRYRRLNYAS